MSVQDENKWQWHSELWYDHVTVRYGIQHNNYRGFQPNFGYLHGLVTLDGNRM
jgi:hypothetical protein